MTKQEQRRLARRIADTSEVLDFETALQLVQWKPEKAERLIRMREESKRRMEELTRANERLHQAALEMR
ncbi:MAG TPA: hypothetical protein VGV69_09385 [Solirubrobacterales bacterium]|nr:hypothetical protein [Solirubrobacterales bacterium]